MNDYEKGLSGTPYSMIPVTNPIVSASEACIQGGECITQVVNAPDCSIDAPWRSSGLAFVDASSLRGRSPEL